MNNNGSVSYIISNYFFLDSAGANELAAWRDKLQSAIALLPSDEQELQPVIQLIVAAIAPATIYRLRHESTSGKKDDDCIDLLLVMPPRCTIPFTELEPVLEFASLKNRRIACSLHQWGNVKEALAKGHLFYTLALRKENLVYNSKEIELPAVAADVIQKIKTTIIEAFNSSLEKASQFYNCAERLYSLQAPLAAFMLQQAAELTLRGVLLNLNGYDKKTHELRSLLKHLRRCAPQLQTVFPGNTNEEEHLLTILQNAYLGARYDLSFTIHAEQMQLLFSWVKQLMETAVLTIKNTIKKL